MSELFRRNLPPKSYAAKRPKPHLSREVEETLSNKRKDINNSDEELIGINPYDTTIDTYYVFGKETYYQGNWMGGLPHGKGNAIYPDGALYYGKFDEGEAEDDHAFLILANGSFYQGEVHKSKISGKGVLIHKRGYRYEGEWWDNKPHGKGKESFGDGSQYVGPFRNGLKHCFESDRTIEQKKENPPKYMAVYRTPHEIYCGEFKDGVMHGYGELTNKEKDFEYFGEFINGKKEGYASMKTAKGRLTGRFHNDLITGEGSFHWYDGRRYEGQFRNSKFHG